ncbi:MAG: hypothetical protein ABH824_03955 [Nanoarchaeota archaeon]|nr:hypothetical protein [Nanoarchaeota archaeon]MBU1632560.1 hypothetical protein [Nanoarchaeota archaeon]MBU1876579.1 hypothetical protein [Nanoarchaeota archaeon]
MIIKQRKILPSGKLAQMEMVGLVVIVILITLGMLFMAIFALKSDNQKKVFTSKGLTSSAMSSIMKTNVGQDANCVSEYIGYSTPIIGKDIIDDCAKYLDNPSYSLYSCIGPISGEKVHSCVFLREIVSHLLEETLGSWNKNYEFHSQIISGVEVKDIIEPIIVGRGGKGCKGVERDTSGLFPINTEAGLVENVLYLC